MAWGRPLALSEPLEVEGGWAWGSAGGDTMAKNKPEDWKENNPPSQLSCVQCSFAQACDFLMAFKLCLNIKGTS